MNRKISDWVGETWKEVADTLNMKKLLELFLERQVEILHVKKGMYLRGRNEAGEEGESCSLVVIHTASNLNSTNREK